MQNGKLVGRIYPRFLSVLYLKLKMVSMYDILKTDKYFVKGTA